jgi:DNA polymerase elongation subunit (family B)
MLKNLINIEHVGTDIVEWWTGENGKVEERRINNFLPGFYIPSKSPNSKFRSIYGQPVEKITFAKVQESRDAHDLYTERFESDLEYVLQYLVERNDFNQNTILLPVKTWFFDLEIVSDNGFPDIKTALNPIFSIAVYDTTLKKTVVFCYHPQEYLNKDKWDEKGVFVFETETEMLKSFLITWNKFHPQIITGWNSARFDTPYLVNRLNRVLGEKMTKTLSPIKMVYPNMDKDGYQIKGVSELDYLKLYKKFNPDSRESYSLNFIANYELGGGKVEYSGTLDQLWKNDFAKFIDYNTHDVDLVVELDARLKYIDLARELTSMSGVPLKYVYYNSVMTDTLVLRELKKRNLVAPDKVRVTDEEYEENDPFKGAAVSDPIVGLHDWIFTLDLSSLYPAIMRSCNISFDTIIERQNVTDLNRHEFYRTANDQYFTKTFRGVIPFLLDNFFEKRVKYRKEQKKAAKAGNEFASYQFDLKQRIMKIFNNAVYGYLGMSGSRFYDKRLAEGVTLTGRMISESSAEYTRKHFPDKVLPLYSDTDSIFFSVLDPNYHNKEKIIELGDKIKDDINNSHLKEFGEKICNILGTESNYFSFKMEKIANPGILFTKKRYALKLIWEEGTDKEEIKISGVETVR